MSEAPLVSIVDDDPSIRRALARLCRMRGFRVQAFSSARDFLASDARAASDCLLLDLRLEGESGLDLQRELRGAGSALPIVFITAHDNPTDRDRALREGAVAFLPKPLDTSTLLEVIEKALRHS